MKKLLGTFPLKNRHSGDYEEASLYSPISENNVSDFENTWKPAMQDRLNDLKPGETVASVNLQDHHWKWREKSEHFNKRLDHNTYSVECAGETQGLMFAQNISFAKEPSQLNQFIVYIEMISSAPWNRHGFSENPKYQGVGPLLVGTAISLSDSLGYGGRIGLHSLPQTESWYRYIGMTDIGPDMKYHNQLRYFEMTPQQAQSYITT